MHWTSFAAPLRDALRLSLALHPDATNATVLLTAVKKDMPKEDALPGAAKKKPPFIPNGVLRLESMEGNGYLRWDVPAFVTTPGTVSIQRAYLAGLRYGETAEFQVQNQQLGYKTGRIVGTLNVAQDEARLQGLRPPRFKVTQGIPAEAMKALLSATRLMTALDAKDTLPLRVTIRDKRLVGYISETYRASLYHSRLPKEFRTQDLGVTMRPGLLAAVASTLSDPLTYAVDSGVLALKTDAMLVHLPLQQKDSSDDIYAKVLQTHEERAKVKPLAQFRAAVSCTFDQEEFVKTLVDIASVHLGAVAQGARVRCDFSADKLALSVVAEHGSAKGFVPLEAGPGTLVRETFNLKYLHEMVSLLPKGKVRAYLFSKGMFLLLESEDSSVTQVLSVLQTDENTAEEDGRARDA